MGAWHGGGGAGDCISQLPMQSDVATDSVPTSRTWNGSVMEQPCRRPLVLCLSICCLGHDCVGCRSGPRLGSWWRCDLWEGTWVSDDTAGQCHHKALGGPPLTVTRERQTCFLKRLFSQLPSVSQKWSEYLMVHTRNIKFQSCEEALRSLSSVPTLQKWEAWVFKERDVLLKMNQ